MSKKDKKKNQELPPLPKYQNEYIIEDLSGQLKVGSSEVERLKNKLANISSEMRLKGLEYLNQTHDVYDSLEEKKKENENLKNEIAKTKKEREDFKANLAKDFEIKEKEAEEAKQKEIQGVKDQMELLNKELAEVKEKNNIYKQKVENLQEEIRRLNAFNNKNIEDYEKKIKNLTEEYHIKLKIVTEIFENFLKNNQELLETDLYTVYRKLKLKFDAKIKECLFFKQKNEELKDENRHFRLSIDNNDDIINECAKIQVEHKKKNKVLSEELDEKNKLILQIQEEYQKQVDDINHKFNTLVKDNDQEIENLKNQLAQKDKELLELKTVSQQTLRQRSEIEIYFMEALNEVRKEIYTLKKKEIERKNNGLFPFLSNSYSINTSNSNSKQDDSIYVTSLKKVEIKDMDPESKEKILRTLLNKINEGKRNKNILKLRSLIS